MLTALKGMRSLTWAALLASIGFLFLALLFVMEALQHAVVGDYSAAAGAAAAGLASWAVLALYARMFIDGLDGDRTHRELREARQQLTADIVLAESRLRRQEGL